METDYWRLCAAFIGAEDFHEPQNSRTTEINVSDVLWKVTMGP